MTTRAGSSGASSARSTQPAAMPARPAGIARGTLGDASEPAMTAMLSGAKTSPLAVCSCSTARNIAGEVVPVMASATSEPRASPGRRSSPGGRSGFGERRWMPVKRTSSSRPAPNGTAHPPASTRLRPNRTAARPRVSVSAPGRSRLPSPRGSSGGNRRPARAAPASPIGTLTANTHSQPGPPVMRPPSTQPDAPPPAAAAVQIASARGRGSVATSSASAEGATSAAPVPCTARAAISAAAVGASAQASEAAAKISSPPRNARRAP
jgi:hypothetical protein